jgi:hypothetical protein
LISHANDVTHITKMMIFNQTEVVWRASIAEGLAFISMDSWRIATNLWPKIAMFSATGSTTHHGRRGLRALLRDERTLVTLLLHRDDRTIVTLLLPTDSEAYVNNRVKASPRRFMVSYWRALGDDTKHGKCRRKHATDAT